MWVFLPSVWALDRSSQFGDWPLPFGDGYFISLTISSPVLFSLIFFLVFLLVRNQTPWLCPLIFLFTFFLLSFSLSFSFLLSGKFPQHYLWTLLVCLCFFFLVIIFLISKNLYLFSHYPLENKILFLFQGCNIFSYFSEDINDEFGFSLFIFYSVSCIVSVSPRLLFILCFTLFLLCLRLCSKVWWSLVVHSHLRVRH